MTQVQRDAADRITAMSAPKVLWLIAIVSGFFLAGALVALGYEADRENTGGQVGPGEISLLVVLLVATSAAVLTTVRRGRHLRPTGPAISRAELAVALLGLVASVVVLPAALLAVGVLVRVVHRALQTEDATT